METYDSRSGSGRRSAPMAMRKSKVLGDITNLASSSSTPPYSLKKTLKEGRPGLGLPAAAADPDGFGIRKRVPADHAAVIAREKSEAPKMLSLVHRKKNGLSKRKFEGNAELLKESCEAPEKKSDVHTEKSVVRREKLEVLEQKLEDHREKSLLKKVKYDFVKETSVISEQKSEVPKEKTDIFKDEATVLKIQSVASKEKFETPGTSVRQCIQSRGEKGKAADFVGHLSCPPLRRIRDLMEQTEMANRDIFSSKASSVPLLKPKKKQRWTTSDAEVHRDFIEKQKAYFAEIDAFELPEEIASDNEPTTEFSAGLEDKLE